MRGPREIARRPPLAEAISALWVFFPLFHPVSGDRGGGLRPPALAASAGLSRAACCVFCAPQWQQARWAKYPRSSEASGSSVCHARKTASTSLSRSGYAPFRVTDEWSSVSRRSTGSGHLATAIMLARIVTSIGLTKCHVPVDLPARAARKICARIVSFECQTSGQRRWSAMLTFAYSSVYTIWEKFASGRIRLPWRRKKQGGRVLCPVQGFIPHYARCL